MNSACVTLDEVFEAAAVRRASLVPETSGYLALAVGDAVEKLPFAVEDRAVLLTTEGTVTLTRRGEPVGPEQAAKGLRDILARLLAVSIGTMPGLAAAARPRKESARGVEGVIGEIEAALIPVNRAAARRALARLARETQRAKESGKLAPKPRAEPAPQHAPRVEAPPPAPLPVLKTTAIKASEPPPPPAAKPVEAAPAIAVAPPPAPLRFELAEPPPLRFELADAPPIPPIALRPTIPEVIPAPTPSPVQKAAPAEPTPTELGMPAIEEEIDDDARTPIYPGICADLDVVTSAPSLPSIDRAIRERNEPRARTVVREPAIAPPVSAPMPPTYAPIDDGLAASMEVIRRAARARALDPITPPFGKETAPPTRADALAATFATEDDSVTAAASSLAALAPLTPPPRQIKVIRELAEERAQPPSAPEPALKHAAPSKAAAVEVSPTPSAVKKRSQKQGSLAPWAVLFLGFAVVFAAALTRPDLVSVVMKRAGINKPKEPAAAPATPAAAKPEPASAAEPARERRDVGPRAERDRSGATRPR